MWLGLEKPWLQSPSELSLRAAAWSTGDCTALPAVKSPAQYWKLGFLLSFFPPFLEPKQSHLTLFLP